MDVDPFAALIIIITITLITILFCAVFCDRKHDSNFLRCLEVWCHDCCSCFISVDNPDNSVLDIIDDSLVMQHTIEHASNITGPNRADSCTLPPNYSDYPLYQLNSESVLPPSYSKAVIEMVQRDGNIPLEISVEPIEQVGTFLVSAESIENVILLPPSITIEHVDTLSAELTENFEATSISDEQTENAGSIILC